jgi:hypothetical protein
MDQFFAFADILRRDSKFRDVGINDLATRPGEPGLILSRIGE